MSDKEGPVSEFSLPGRLVLCPPVSYATVCYLKCFMLCDQ